MKNEEYRKYIHSSQWRQKADERLKLDGGKCCVCGGDATEVHHLTYENLGKEKMEDLVSLCRRCHEKAEDLYNPQITPWAMEEVKPEGNNFMAAMRVDAQKVAKEVAEYLEDVRGGDFESLMDLRAPVGQTYWVKLKKAVYALCRKRYSRNCVGDRADMMLKGITNHTVTILLSHIEHYLKNCMQRKLHEKVMAEYEVFGKWKDVAENLGISVGTAQRMRKDDGTSFGPSLRESVLYYCGLDAAAGIAPLAGFECLSADDYEMLKEMAEYMREVSGSGAFKGEGR